MARLRRRQLEEEGVVVVPPVEEYDAYGDPLDAFPEAPPDGGNYGNNYPEAPQPVKPGTIKRQPLNEAAIEPVEPTAPGDQAALPPNIDGKIVVDPSLSLGARQDVAALQVLLDRAGASPGVIDGRFGSNVDKAIAAYNEITGSNLQVDRCGRHPGGACSSPAAMPSPPTDHARGRGRPLCRIGAGRLRPEGASSNG